jgi:hypothetical protein
MDKIKAPEVILSKRILPKEISESIRRHREKVSEFFKKNQVIDLSLGSNGVWRNEQ